MYTMQRLLLTSKAISSSFKRDQTSSRLLGDVDNTRPVKNPSVSGCKSVDWTAKALQNRDHRRSCCASKKKTSPSRPGGASRVFFWLVIGASTHTRANARVTRQLQSVHTVISGTGTFIFTKYRVRYSCSICLGNLNDISMRCPCRRYAVEYTRGSLIE